MVATDGGAAGDGGGGEYGIASMEGEAGISGDKRGSVVGLVVGVQGSERVVTVERNRGQKRAAK